MGTIKLIYIHIKEMQIMMNPGDRRMMNKRDRINPISGKLMELTTAD